MIDSSTIRQLAERTAPDRCFLSIYVNKEDIDWLRGRLDTEGLVEGPTDIESENLGPTLEMARDWFEENPITSKGVALFACWADDYLEAVELEVPVERRVVVDSSPFVMPLAEIADEFETWCVALVDHDSARIFEISGLEIDEVDRAAGNIKNHVKVGGWSQQRYERRREKEIANFCDEIADRLDDLVGDGPCDKLFLAGNEHLVAELNRELPPRLQKHLAGTESMAGDLADHEVFEAMKPLIEKAERQSEASLVEEIKNQRFRDGRAATGPEDTLEALRHGRVYRLLVDREAEQPAIRCRDCEWLTIPKQDDVLPDNCPVCKGDIFEVDLTNEMVELAHKTDAEVETADPMPQLDEWDGIAALLRY